MPSPKELESYSMQLAVQFQNSTFFTALETAFGGDLVQSPTNYEYNWLRTCLFDLARILTTESWLSPTWAPQFFWIETTSCRRTHHPDLKKMNSTFLWNEQYEQYETSFTAQQNCEMKLDIWFTFSIGREELPPVHSVVWSRDLPDLCVSLQQTLQGEILDCFHNSISKIKRIESFRRAGRRRLWLRRNCSLGQHVPLQIDEPPGIPSMQV